MSFFTIFSQFGMPSCIPLLCILLHPPLSVQESTDKHVLSSKTSKDAASFHSTAHTLSLQTGTEGGHFICSTRNRLRVTDWPVGVAGEWWDSLLSWLNPTLPGSRNKQFRITPWHHSQHWHSPASATGLKGPSAHQNSALAGWATQQPDHRANVLVEPLKRGWNYQKIFPPFFSQGRKWRVYQASRRQTGNKQSQWVGCCLGECFYQRQIKTDFIYLYLILPGSLPFREERLYEEMKQNGKVLFLFPVLCFSQRTCSIWPEPQSQSSSTQPLPPPDFPTYTLCNSWLSLPSSSYLSSQTIPRNTKVQGYTRTGIP